MSKKLLFNFNREVIQNYTYVKYVGTIITATNTLEKPIKSASLKGSTKYRDIDTGEILEAFEEGRNLELVSVRMPGLTTSNEDGTKTNILTVNEDVTLRGVGGVKDELDCLTGEITQRIVEIVLDGSDDEEWERNPGNDSKNTAVFYIPKVLKHNAKVIMDKFIPSNDGNFWFGHRNDRENHLNNSYDLAIRISKSKLSSIDISGFRQWLSQNPVTVQHTLMTEPIKTVDLSILDQNENKVNSISSFNDTTHIMASSETIPPTFEGYLATKEVE